MSQNDVTINEFMDLMKILHSEPYIVLNMGLGSIDDVKEEIEYFNEDT